MRKEYASLRRRPFLAPVWLAALAALAFLALAWWILSAASTTTVLVMRHAEKAALPGEDPPLSPAGEQRAQALAQHFGRARGELGLDCIIVSEFKRSHDTVRPLATRLGIPVITVPAEEIERAAERALSEYRGGRVLIVGHSNTVPQLVEELSGQKVPAMSEAEYGIVYLVSVPRFSRAAITRFDLP